MPEKRTKTVAYKASDLNSLKDLELSAERDEGRLGKLIQIELATLDSSDGEKAVALTFERVPLSSPINIGNLVFQEFSDAADFNVKKANLLLAQATPVLPGDNPTADNSKAKVFIKNATLNILVFRDKAP
jgi:hypothetical protein